MKICFSAALFILAFTGCRSFDLTMNSTDQYSTLYDSPISITTSDSIIVIRNMGGGLSRSKVFVPVIFTIDYKLSKDSIIYSGHNFTGIIPFGIIKSVECRGVWDEETGFISEKEIIKNRESSIGVLTPVLMGLGGIPIGGVVGSAFRTRTGFIDMGMVEVVMGGIAGFLAGVIAGTILEKDSEYDSAIERIKEKRLHKNPNQNMIK